MTTTDRLTDGYMIATHRLTDGHLHDSNRQTYLLNCGGYGHCAATIKHSFGRKRGTETKAQPCDQLKCQFTNPVPSLHTARPDQFRFVCYIQFCCHSEVFLYVTMVLSNLPIPAVALYRCWPVLVYFCAQVQKELWRQTLSRHWLVNLEVKWMRSR